MGLISRVESDVYVNGNLSVKTLAIPSGTVVDDDVNASAAIAATKLEQRHVLTYGQTGNAASATIPIHCVHGATATLIAFEAGSVAKAAGDSTMTFDLKKNGTTCLSAVITLDNANTAYVAEAGTLSVTAAVDGDVLTIVTAATVGTGTLPTGCFCTLTLDEDPT